MNTEPIFRHCNVCGRELRLDSELAVGACAICMSEEVEEKAPAKKHWRIEYEIPPMRAIYHAEADNCTEDEVRNVIAAKRPKWHIRKLTAT